MKKLITAVVTIHFLFLLTAHANTLKVDEQGNVSAETNRYFAAFTEGTLTHFHNKLTNETYTRESAKDRDWYLGETLFLTTDSRINHLKDIEKPSPLRIKMTYEEHGATYHLWIGIDRNNGDLLIQQTGTVETGGAYKTKWSIINLSHTETDIILPATGGHRLTRETVNDLEAHYPGEWEAQLAIFQGHRGGFYLYSKDTQFGFKDFNYQRHDDDFRVTLTAFALAPFEKRKHLKSSVYRLNSYKGTYERPASMYRDWMHKAFEIDRRSPRWVDDIKCVIKHHGDLDPNIVRKLYQLVDPSQTLIYIYKWHEDTGDPPHRRDGFQKNLGAFLREAHRYNFRVMIHTSISHIQVSDPIYPSFEQYHVRDPYSGKKEGYKLYDPTYHSPAATINPAAAAFRNMLVRELKYVCDTYAIDAVHLDFSTHIKNDRNGRIDNMTMAEGVIALHQEIRKALPNIVLSGETLSEASYPYEEFAQRWFLGHILQPHPISNFLFPNIRFYGHLGHPNPDSTSEQKRAKYKASRDEHETWNVLPTVTLWDIDNLGIHQIETHKLLKRIREYQGYTFGDINQDGVVNILDLTLIAQHLGKESTPQTKHIDINKDGTINILDLTRIAQHL